MPPVRSRCKTYMESTHTGQATHFLALRVTTAMPPHRAAPPADRGRHRERLDRRRCWKRRAIRQACRVRYAASARRKCLGGFASLQCALDGFGVIIRTCRLVYAVGTLLLYQLDAIQPQRARTMRAVLPRPQHFYESDVDDRI
jgi:hypothetical protein